MISSPGFTVTTGSLMLLKNEEPPETTGAAPFDAAGALCTAAAATCAAGATEPPAPRVSIYERMSFFVTLPPIPVPLIASISVMEIFSF
ncbi:hypothetical protein D3C80_1144250 [compost metagenome]